MKPAQLAEEESVPKITRVQSVENHCTRNTSAPLGGGNGGESSLAVVQVKLEPVEFDAEPNNAMQEGATPLRKLKTSMDNYLAYLEQEEAEALNRSTGRESSLQKENENLKKAIQEKNAAMGVLDAEMVLLKDDLERSKTEIEELQDQLSSSNNQIEDLKKANDRKERSLTVQRKEMEKEKNASIAKVAALEGQGQSNRKTIHALRKKLEDQQIESEGKVRKLEKVVQDKDKAIENLRKEMEESRIKSSEQNLQALKEKDQKDETIRKLKKKLESQNSEMSKEASKYKAMMQFLKDMEETPQNQERSSNKKVRLEETQENPQPSSSKKPRLEEKQDQHKGLVPEKKEESGGSLSQILLKPQPPGKLRFRRTVQYESESDCD